MKKIIAVINQKGGVGKTTTSINFSCCLAQRNYKVLLIDLDPQAHSTTGLGIEQDQYNFTINEVLTQKTDTQTAILETEIENLHIIPSHIKLDKTETEITLGIYKEARLYSAIQHLDYDFVVIDCRPSLGALSLNAVYACNFVIVPCEVARYSLDGFSDLLDTIKVIKNNTKIDKNFIKILLTKYDSRKTNSNDWFFEQLTNYSDLLFETRIRQNEALNQASMLQKPICVLDKNSHGAKDYDSLTDEFLKLCQLK